MKKLPFGIVAVVLLLFVQTEVFPQQVISVVSQPRPEWDLMQKLLPNFIKETGINVEIKFFAEAERRSKERLDAATGAGVYQIYYMDETNVSEFASAGWVLPILKYYPQNFDFKDFIPAWVNIASYEGVAYFAPVIGMGDFLMYRKDILKEKGISVPKTLDQYMSAVKRLNDPPKIYGNVTRGARTTNWWRWGTFFFALGGKYLDGNKPVFNSPEAVEATKLYMDMVKNAPPGTATFDWGECGEAFRSGKAVFFIDADAFYDWNEDPKKSNIAGKVGYAAPPAGPAGAFSAGAVHGLGISASGCKTEATRRDAARFIAWATSKENEMNRLKNGIVSVYARTSTLESPAMAKAVPGFLIEALKARAKVTGITYMRKPQWPQISEKLGITLEEILTGSRTDIQGALDEAVAFAEESLSE